MEIVINSEKYGIKKCYIDKSDYRLVKSHTWRVNFVRGTFYALTTICKRGEKPKTIKMHRLIMGVFEKPFPHIDHRDRNGLNNTKSNLRSSTISQNAQNIGATVRSTTGYKGVYLYKPPHKSAGLYTATLRSKEKKYHGGYFKTAEEAAKRYNELAIEHHGDFAFLNTIPIYKGDNSVTA